MESNLKRVIGDLKKSRGLGETGANGSGSSGSNSSSGEGSNPIAKVRTSLLRIFLIVWARLVLLIYNLLPALLHLRRLWRC